MAEGNNNTLVNWVVPTNIVATAVIAPKEDFLPLPFSVLVES